MLEEEGKEEGRVIGVELYMRDKIIEVSEESFERDVVKGEGGMVVDLWGEWWGGWKMMGGIVDEMGEEYEGKVRVGKVKMDEKGGSGGKYGMGGMGSVVVLKKGEVGGRKVGCGEWGFLLRGCGGLRG